VGELVSNGSLPGDLQGANAADRRKDRRFEVELHGELRYSAAAFAVQIADISASGALVFMEDPPPPGSKAELWIEDFGILPIEIMHSGEYFCGVAITDPVLYRDRLLDWLRQETISGGPAAAVR
jgi:PilZ domain